MTTKNTIDLTPSWSMVLPALIALLDVPESRDFAISEFRKMATLADKHVDHYREVVRQAQAKLQEMGA